MIIVPCERISLFLKDRYGKVFRRRRLRHGIQCQVGYPLESYPGGAWRIRVSPMRETKKWHPGR